MGFVVGFCVWSGFLWVGVGLCDWVLFVVGFCMWLVRVRVSHARVCVSGWESQKGVEAVAGGFSWYLCVCARARACV